MQPRPSLLTHLSASSSCMCYVRFFHPRPRWSEVTRKLEMWVQILELNENGEYMPVEVVSAGDVRTGGIFQLRQVTLTTEDVILNFWYAQDIVIHKSAQIYEYAELCKYLPAIFNSCMLVN